MDKVVYILGLLVVTSAFIVVPSLATCAVLLNWEPVFFWIFAAGSLLEWIFVFNMIGGELL